MLNLGGPGWFKDVFEVEVEIDGEREIASHSLLFQEKCQLFGADESVHGRVKITPPPNRTVWHDGVYVEVESNLSFFETLTTKDVKEISAEIQQPGYISEEAVIEFELDLRKLSKDFLETYDGELFNMHHAIIVTVKRPWWTFDVFKGVAVAIHKLQAAPEQETHFIDDDFVETNDDVTEKPKKHRLRVIDVRQGLSMVFERSCLNLRESFKAEITLCEEVPPQVKRKLPTSDDSVHPLKELELILYKIESGDEESNEVLVLKKNIKLDESIDNTTTSQTIAVEFPLVKTPDSMGLSPTLSHDLINVRYYIRLVALDDQGSKFWNTHEVVLYRQNLQAETI